MPYICMARDDIPEGTLQVLDLFPNSSQFIPAYTPGTGQTRYINRPEHAHGFLTDNGSPSTTLKGLTAYLMDRVEPGSHQVAHSEVTMVDPHDKDIITLAGVDFICLERQALGTAQMNAPADGDTFTIKGLTFTCVEKYAMGSYAITGPVTAGAAKVTVNAVPLAAVHSQATGTITCSGVLAGDTVNIAGITTASGGADGFIAVAGPAVAANGEFLDAASAGSDIATADSLRLAIIACSALISASRDAAVPAAPAGGYLGSIDPDAAGAAAITLTSSLYGDWGDAPVVSSNGAHLAVTGMTHTALIPGTNFGTTDELYSNEAVAIDLAASIAAAPGVSINASAGVGAGGTTVYMIATVPRGLLGQYPITTDGMEITRSGATLVCPAANPTATPIAADPLNPLDPGSLAREFLGTLQVAGGNPDISNSLSAAILDLTNQAAFLAAVPPGISVLGFSDAVDTVAMQVVDALNVPVLGLQGELPMAENTGGTTIILGPGLGTNLVARAPDPTLQEFAGILQAVGGTNADVALSLLAAVTDPAVSIPAMQALTPANQYIDAHIPLLTPEVVHFTAVDNAGAPLAGTPGNLECNSGNTATLVPDALTAQTLVLNRDNQSWYVPSQEAAANAILARVDAGLPLTAAALNTLLDTAIGADFDGLAGVPSLSNGVVSELLDVLSGRGYQVATSERVMWSVWQKNPTQVGSFTTPVTVFGTHMIAGEIKPLAISGDTVQRENKGVRHTVDSTAFQVSLLNGMLNSMTGPTVLFPDSDEVPYFPWTMQHGTHYSQTTASRLVTVYDDDGTVLA